MFFKNKKQNNIPEATPVRVSSFLTRNSKFEGNITTGDNVEIGGEFIGNIDCKREIIIGEFGSILGDIKAEKITSNGKIVGKVICDSFEGDDKSFTKDKIEAKSVSMTGIFEGVIECETLCIKESGNVKATVQAKNIEISGKIEGDIACETLSTTMHANVKGKLFVNQLLNNGGTIDGFIGKYQEILTNEIEIEKEGSKISNNVEAVKEKELLPS